jgi:hypothetical protein
MSAILRLQPATKRRNWFLLIAGGIAALLVLALVGGTLADQFYAARARAGGYTMTVAVAREDATSLSLAMTLSGGRAAVRGGATDLVSAQSTREDIGLQPVTRAGRSVSVDLRMLEGPYMFGPESSWTVEMPSDVPVAIALEGAGGPFTLDLHDVQLTAARVGIGAAGLTLIAPAPRGDVPITISGSTPISTTIDVPDGVNYRITGGTVDGQRETPGYATTTDRLTITLTSNVSMTVR